MFVISIVSISKFYDSLRYRIEQVSKRERERERERERNKPVDRRLSHGDSAGPVDHTKCVLGVG